VTGRMKIKKPVRRLPAQTFKMILLYVIEPVRAFRAQRQNVWVEFTKAAASIHAASVMSAAKNYPARMRRVIALSKRDLISKKKSFSWCLRRRSASIHRTSPHYHRGWPPWRPR
jgi:hypothetical protein